MSDIWEKIKKPIGKPRAFKTDADLWKKCKEYFEWMRDNPIEEDKIFCQTGIVTHGKVSHPRALTFHSLCLFLGIHRMLWAEWRNAGRYPLVIKTVDDIIYRQKFEGAAVGQFNTNIIARDLGLAEKKEISAEVTSKNVDFGIEAKNPIEAARIYQEMIRQNRMEDYHD